MRALPIVLLLAACFARPADAPARRTAAPAVRQNPAIVPVDGHAVPQPGTLKTFGDWTVGCDNVRTCTLASLGEADGGDFPAVTIAITRGGAADAVPAVAFDPQDDGTHPPPHVAAAAVDGRAVDPANGAALVPAMADGHRLTLRDDHGATIASQSLSGASAALRFVDAEQRRAGGVTALVALGPAPASAVPALPPLPVIVAVVPSGAPVMPDKATLKALAVRAAGDAGAPDASVTADPEAYALGGGATLVLVPWSSGAYNLTAALFVVRGGRAMPAQIDAPSGFGATDSEHEAVPGVVNGSFDGGVLQSYAKGRGLGDCGDAQSFVWDGTRFRLSAQSDMGECRGNPHCITTWRTRVVWR